MTYETKNYKGENSAKAWNAAKKELINGATEAEITVRHKFCDSILRRDILTKSSPDSFGHSRILSDGSRLQGRDDFELFAF